MKKYNDKQKIRQLKKALKQLLEASALNVDEVEYDTLKAITNAQYELKMTDGRVRYL